MANQQFKVMYGLDANNGLVTQAIWRGEGIRQQEGGTGTTNGSINGLNTITLTAGYGVVGGNYDVALVPKGTGKIDASNFRIANVAAPVNGGDATNKTYVDNLVQGLYVKNSVRIATTGNISLSTTAQTIDGVAIQVGDRILVKNQTNASENGIYNVAASNAAWSRSTDANTWDELVSAYVFIQEGNVLKDTGWVCIVDAGGTLGTTAVNWTQFSGAGTYTASLGVKINPDAPNQFILDLTGSSGKTAVTTTDSQTLVNKTLQAAKVDTSISATVGAGSIIDTSVKSFSTNSPSTGQPVDTTPTATYRSISYIIQISNPAGGGNYQQSQVNVIFSGSDAYITEYGTLVTGSPLANFSAAVENGNIILKVDPLNLNSNYSYFKLLKSAFTL